MINKTSRYTSKTGANLVLRNVSHTDISSVNIWIKRTNHRFDLDHLCEHLIAFKLREICKPTIHGIYGAKIDEDTICIFARIKKIFIKKFIDAVLQCFSIDDYYFSSQRIRKEIGVISNEINKQGGAYNRINSALAISHEHNLDNVDSSQVHNRLCQLSISSHWTVDIISQSDEIDYKILLSTLDCHLSQGHQISKKIIYPTDFKPKIVTDQECALVAIQFHVKLDDQLEYQAMLLLSRLITGSASSSLSRELRETGMTYSIDRKFSLINGYGQHTLYIRTRNERLKETKRRIIEFFSRDVPFSDQDYTDAIIESNLLQQIAVENLGVLASRLGSYEQTYSLPADVNTMTKGLVSENLEYFRKIFERFYFNNSFMEIQL